MYKIQIQNIHNRSYNQQPVFVYLLACGVHLWMRMLWSWCPCVAIITSASSRTNTLIFLGSMSFSLTHQSRTVPGVPMTICSLIITPRSTGRGHSSHHTYKSALYIARFWGFINHLLWCPRTAYASLTSGIKLAHLLDDFTRLQSELICGRNAQTLQDRHRLGHQIINHIYIIVHTEMKLTLVTLMITFRKTWGNGRNYHFFSKNDGSHRIKNYNIATNSDFFIYKLRIRTFFPSQFYFVSLNYEFTSCNSATE